MKNLFLKLMALGMVASTMTAASAHADDGYQGKKKGTIIGAIIGGVVGAAVGDEEGAVIGAVVGGVAGREIGRDNDHDRYRRDDRNDRYGRDRYGRDRRDRRDRYREVYQCQEYGRGRNVGYILVELRTNRVIQDYSFDYRACQRDEAYYNRR